MKKYTKNTHKTDRKIVNILGIVIDSTSKERVLAGVKEMMTYNTKFYVVTPNPEQILSAVKNPMAKKALNGADFAIPDGVGLRAAEWDLKVIKGRDLFMDLVNLAHRKRWKMFFLGGLDNEAELAAKKLGARYFKGPSLDNNAEPATEAGGKLQIAAIKRINNFKPHLLFVAFGNPKQEIWIYKNLPKLNIGGAMAVGGTFRYIAGLSKLPPKWMERAGIEWLWRLFTEPVRLKRIWNAVIVFPLRVWTSRL